VSPLRARPEQERDLGYGDAWQQVGVPWPRVREESFGCLVVPARSGPRLHYYLRVRRQAP
jgi:hypothetical protein